MLLTHTPGLPFLSAHSPWQCRRTRPWISAAAPKGHPTTAPYTYSPSLRQGLARCYLLTLLVQHADSSEDASQQPPRPAVQRTLNTRCIIRHGKLPPVAAKANRWTLSAPTILSANPKDREWSDRCVPPSQASRRSCRLHRTNHPTRYEIAVRRFWRHAARMPPRYGASQSVDQQERWYLSGP